MNLQRAGFAKPKQDQWRIPVNYKLIKIIGEGSYGMVGSAFYRKTPQTADEDCDIVAIKRISILTLTDWYQYKQVLRELEILSQLKHENIIDVLDAFVEPHLDNPKFISIVMPMMEVNLWTKLKNEQLSSFQIEIYLYQILCGVKYIHSAKIMHRDLKTLNILVNASEDLKICDFGLARVIENPYFSMNELGKQANMTPEMFTVVYSAPETYLSPTAYTLAADIWSVGCIGVELIKGSLLFHEENLHRHIAEIVTFLGTPSQEDMAWILDFNKRRKLETLPFAQSNCLENMFPYYKHPELLRLLNKLLVFNPWKRLTAEQALQHPFFDFIYDANDAVSSSEPVLRDDKASDVPLAELKLQIKQEVIKIQQRQKQKQSSAKD